MWWYCCKYENIDPVNPSRLPLLFALDAKLHIADGFVYHPQCEALRRDGQTAAAGYCGGDFASTSFDGSTAGFGDAGSDSSSSGDGAAAAAARCRGGGGDGGGGGGCGGGGD